MLGRNEGIKQTTIDMIKVMFHKKMSYSDIADISGKSIDEIKKIEQTIK